MSPNPLSGDVPPSVVARYMQSPDRLASMMMKDMPGWEATPAEILADIINVMRADQKALAQAQGVDMTIDLMTEDRAAALMAGITDGDAVELVRVFNAMAKDRDKILEAAMDEEDYQDFMARKTSVMMTDDPDTWDGDDGDDGGADA